ncbi:MAG TPA: membrane protein insertase YidC [Phycisphaerales bacterium]|nr:membrane protein insertase YidC [Phycisphaerales bacterium]
MNPSVRRILIPLIVGFIAMTVVLTMLLPGSKPAAQPEQPQPAPEQAAQPAEVPVSPEADDAADAPAEDAIPVRAMTGLRAIAPPDVADDPDQPASSLGSLDPQQHPMFIEFTRAGAGMTRITLSDHWQTAHARQQAERHARAVASRDPNPPPMPDESLRYMLIEQQPLHTQLGTFTIPILSANGVFVGETFVSLFSGWAEVSPGHFQTLIVNEYDEPVLRITRRYVLGEHGDMTLVQRIENLTTQELNIRWVQYGPHDLVIDRARYFDRRRARFGYVLRPELDRGRQFVVSDDNDLVFERADLFKKFDANTNFKLWPNAASEGNGYQLSWFAMVNRYYALAVHPVLDAQGQGDRTLTRIVSEVRFEPSPRSAEVGTVFTYLTSPTHAVAPGAELSLDLGVYAGLLDRKLLSGTEPFASLGMKNLILYQMSTFCAICTFKWLADLLILFLALLHDYVLFDWGLAIIGLVVVVRTILHPITKRSQINMMRFGKQMQAMKPEIDKLQQKYKTDPKKLQQEQIRLMREHGVNPFQMLGCLPMFLQVPIWIALYAMLYFAADILHQPAFFGVFQWVGSLFGAYWPFLADLSTGDHFFGEFAEPKTLWFWHLTGINVLPILMAFVLFVHQKYMTPPPGPTMTPEQIQQQKIMRVMIVGMMPIFLYNAPAGLTLYILTSSIIGIVESKYIRAHVDQMDLTPKPTEPKKKKIKDPQARAYAEALERAKKKQEDKRKGPPPSFKKRK